MHPVAGKDTEGRTNTVHKEKGKFIIVHTVRKYTNFLNVKEDTHTFLSLRTS